MNIIDLEITNIKKPKSIIVVDNDSKINSKIFESISSVLVSGTSLNSVLKSYSVDKSKVKQILNEPQKGFKIVGLDGRRVGKRITDVVMQDPRGFLFYITIENLLHSFGSVTLSNYSIEDEMYYGCYNKKIILIPVGSRLDNIINNIKNSTPVKEKTLYEVYKDEFGKEFIYFGVHTINKQKAYLRGESHELDWYYSKYMRNQKQMFTSREVDKIFMYSLREKDIITNDHKLMVYNKNKKLFKTNTTISLTDDEILKYNNNIKYYCLKTYENVDIYNKKYFKISNIIVDLKYNQRYLAEDECGNSYELEFKNDYFSVFELTPTERNIKHNFKKYNELKSLYPNLLIVKIDIFNIFNNKIFFS